MTTPVRHTSPLAEGVVWKRGIVLKNARTGQPASGSEERISPVYATRVL
jgi:hypothetical protein